MSRTTRVAAALLHRLQQLQAVVARTVDLCADLVRHEPRLRHRRQQSSDVVRSGEREATQPSPRRSGVRAADAAGEEDAHAWGVDEAPTSIAMATEIGGNIGGRTPACQHPFENYHTP